MSSAGAALADLVSRLLFEVHIRAGGMPPAPLATPALAVQAVPTVAQSAIPSA